MAYHKISNKNRNHQVSSSSSVEPTSSRGQISNSSDLRKKNDCDEDDEVILLEDESKIRGVSLRKAKKFAEVEVITLDSSDEESSSPRSAPSPPALPDSTTPEKSRKPSRNYRSTKEAKRTHVTSSQSSSSSSSKSSTSSSKSSSSKSSSSESSSSKLSSSESSSSESSSSKLSSSESSSSESSSSKSSFSNSSSSKSSSSSSSSKPLDHGRKRRSENSDDERSRRSKRARVHEPENPSTTVVRLPSFRSYRTYYEPRNTLRNAQDGLEYELNGSVVVYTDGACSNPGDVDISNAGIGVYWADNHPDNLSVPLSGKQTPVRAEFQAAVAALRLAANRGYGVVTVRTDCAALIDIATGHEQPREELRQDYADLANAMSKCRTVYWQKVKAHSGVKGNEAADFLAKRCLWHRRRAISRFYPFPRPPPITFRHL